MGITNDIPPITGPPLTTGIPSNKLPQLPVPLFGLADTRSPGITATASAEQRAGDFEGNVQINGDLGVAGNMVIRGDIILKNEDCAEQFNVTDGLDSIPGTVMTLSDEGLLRPSQIAYDKRVAGVISGAGSYRPAVTLGVTSSIHRRVPIALLGKVYCWADADASPIKVGDLLTSSSTEGHAMAATEPARAFGAIIGKALQPLASGKGLIPILVALQ